MAGDLDIRKIFAKPMNNTRMSYVQDFMFACSMYPADPDTLANVEREVVHQVCKKQ